MKTSHRHFLVHEILYEDQHNNILTGVQYYDHEHEIDEKDHYHNWTRPDPGECGCCEAGYEWDD